MKHTRRPLSLLLALMMIVSLFSGLTVTASADQLPAITVESGEKTVDKDGKITVPVSISDNPGFTYAYLTVSYDDTALKLTAVDSDVVATDLTKNTIELEGNKGKSNFTGNGTLFTMTFEALKNGESSVSLAYKDGDSGNITNVAEEKVLVSFTPGTVTVKGLPGGEPEEPDYTLRVLTFEDKDYKGDVNFAGGNNWSSLIDDPQYSGTLLYGEGGEGVNDIEDAYYWYDKGNTELYSVLSKGYGSWAYWSGGHAVSHYASGNVADNGGYDKQLTVYKAGIGDVTTGGGHNGSDNFAVHYGYADNSGYGLTEASLPTLKFKDGSTHVIDHMYVTNTTYAMNCYVSGNDLTASIGEGDWVKLVAKGYTAAGVLTDTAEIYLCNGPENIVRDWTMWDLSGLGEVSYVTFNVTGSSDNGAGFSQPAYFAYDDVAVRFPAEPEHTHTLTRREAVAPTCGKDGNSEYYSCECGKFFSDADGKTEIEENSWILEKTNEHTDTKNNETQANGKDGLCDVCGTYCNRAPVLKEGVTDTTANVVVGEAYLLRDLQAGKIFEDPDGDALSIAGGGSGNAESKTNYYYNRSTDGGETWSAEMNFASALFGATTISLTEKETGTYLYRFYAKDGYGGDSRDAGDYWYLTLNVDEASELTFATTFNVGKDQNGNMPIIKVYPSLGTDAATGYAIPDRDHPVTFLNSDFAAAEDAANGSFNDSTKYNQFFAKVKGGWYVVEGYGYNAETEAYDIDLGGMQVKIPADDNVDGASSGGTNLYFGVVRVYTTSKKTDSTYFGAEDYTAKLICPLLQCTVKPGTPYKSGNNTYYPHMAYLSGNACLYNYYVYPTDTETYSFSQSINKAIAATSSLPTALSLTINEALPLTVTVPETAKFGLYFQYNNFNTSEQTPKVDWKANGDGTKTATYKVSKGNANYTWRMTDTTGTYVTKAGWLPQQTAAKSMTLTFEGASTEKFSHDFDNLGTITINRDEADLQVNLDPTGAKTLTGTTRVRAYRWWELINSDTANIMVEPDEHWDVISGPATITYVDDTVTVTGTQVDSGNGYHNWADITPNGGTSVIGVHYDAIDVYTDLAVSAHGTHGGFYPATNPDRVNFVIVSDAPMGSAVAHVPYNSDGNGTQRSAEWDYAYDTYYYLRGDEAAALTFTADNETKAEYAYATSDASFNYTISGFTAVTAEDGSYTVPLTAFDNAADNYGGTLIIRLTDANGAYSYQLVHVAGVVVNVVNKSSGESIYLPGDNLEITFTGMYRSVNKMSGVFNPTTFGFRYTVDGTETTNNLGQYMRADKVVMKVTVPADIDFNGEDTAALHFTNGYFYGSMYCAANPFSTIYEMTDTGVGTNFNAITCSWSMQNFADFDVEVSKQPFNFRVNITDGENTVSGATIILKKDGAVVTPNADGVYESPFGTYSYDMSCDGFMRTIGNFKFAMADGDKAVDGVVTYDLALNKVTEKTWDGKTATAPAKNADGYYEIANGAELAWFAQQVNAKTGAAYKVILVDDIDLGMQTWTPIGSSSTIQFKGTFDGNGHAIRNLYCEGAGNQGLFGSVGAGGLLKNFAVYGQVNSTKANAAGICAYTNGAATFEGLANFAEVNITGVAATANAACGGIVGQGAKTTTIQNCYNAGSIYDSGKYVGGICAGSTSSATAPTVTNCYNVGQVTTGSTTLTNAGSLATYATATNSYFLDGTTNGTAVKGTAKTETEMKSAEFVTTLGDAFAPDVQNINQGYPILNWQIKPVEVTPTVEDGKASAELPADTVVAENKPAELDVTASDETVTETELTVPAAVMENLAKAEEVTIKSNVGSISFDKTAFAGIASGAAQSNVTISIKEEAAPNGAPGVAEGAKFIELTAADADGKNLFDGSGSGSATITIPYEAEVAEGNVPVVYYFNGSDYEKVDCTYDAANKTVTFTVSHFSGYLTTQEAAPKEYTIAAIADKSSVYKDGTVKVSVKVSGNTFEGAEVVLTYNKDLFTYVSNVNTVSGATVAKVEDGKIRVQFSSTTAVAADTVLTELSFTANTVTTTTQGSFGFDFAKAGDTAWTYKDNWPAATTTPATVSVVKQFTVKFLDKDGNEISDSTQTVDQGAKVTTVPTAPTVDHYDFDKWYVGETGYTADQIKEATVTADVTYKAGYTPKQYDVTLANGLTGSEKASYNSDYVVTVSGYDADNYDYTVKYTVGDGEEKTATDNQNGTFTIPGGELTDTVSVEVIKVIKGVTIKLFEDYVTGYTLILASGSATNGYQYNGNAMYKVAYTFDQTEYGFGYVVSGEVTEAAAAENLTTGTAAPTDATASGDVNGTGDISYEDAQAAFGVANKIGSLTVRLMLRADVNRDGEVNAADISAILMHSNYRF